MCKDTGVSLFRYYNKQKNDTFFFLHQIISKFSMFGGCVLFIKTIFFQCLFIFEKEREREQGRGKGRGRYGI